MFNVLSTEFLKLRRSRMLFFAAAASILPALVRYLQNILGKSRDIVNWEGFLATNQELKVLAMLAAVVLVSNFIFSMEYQYSTVSYIFTSNVSRRNIFIAKMASLLVVITFLLAVSALSDLLFGYLVFGGGLSGELLLKFIKVVMWYVLSYFLLSSTVVMLVVLTKRFIVSAVMVLGFIMLVFPFHLKNNPYICPFMTPAVVASKLYHSNDYILTGYYKDVSINNFSLAVFLAVIFVVSLAVGMFFYKKSDALQ